MRSNLLCIGIIKKRQKFLEISESHYISFYLLQVSNLIFKLSFSLNVFSRYHCNEEALRVRISRNVNALTYV